MVAITPASFDDLRHRLAERATEEGLRWLAGSERSVRESPAAIGALFPAVGRRIGRGALCDGPEPPELRGWTVDDAGRALLLAAAGAEADAQLDGLYRHGDRAERRGVLRALGLLAVGEAGVALVHDALRSNDLELIAAAMGPYALEHLDDDALAHAVLKCVFVGIAVGELAGLDARTTPRLSQMLAAYTHERIAAGREVPAEVWPLIDRHPPRAELRAIAAELDHPGEHRRRAARAALAQRPAA